MKLGTPVCVFSCFNMLWLFQKDNLSSIQSLSISKWLLEADVFTQHAQCV